MANSMYYDASLKAELAQYLYNPNASIKISDQDILKMDLVELRKKLNEIGCSEMVKAEISTRRRMLKSRGYAQGARDRHRELMEQLLEEKQRLEAEKKLLQQQVDFYEGKM